MDDGLYSFGDMFCTVWCRATQYRSYKNVYAVNIGRTNENTCVVRSHKVVGALANGEVFVGFLVKSLKRRRSLAIVSNSHHAIDDNMPRCAHWVVVEADSRDAAVAHPDVEDVRHNLLNPFPESFCGVYFVSNGNGCVKVGQTTNTLTSRLAQLQAGSPHRLYVCASIMTDKRKALEKQIHNSLNRRRMHGEWFALSDDEAVAIAREHGGQEVLVGRKKTRQMPRC